MNYSEILSSPLAVSIYIQIVAVLVAKFDKSNRISGIIKRLVDKLDTK